MTRRASPDGSTNNRRDAESEGGVSGVILGA